MNDLHKIIVPYRLTRNFIRSKKHELIFIFSDSYNNRHAYFGQASEAKGEPNCKVVFTSWKPCTNRTIDCFFYDEEFDIETKDIIDECISKIPRDRPIIPFPKIAQGCSALDKKAPRTYKYLMDQINYLAYKNVYRDYNLIV